MKAPPFAYIRANSLPEVFGLLATHGDGARLLAGGQSLLASLNLRLSAPEVLIDITRVPGLSDITVSRGQVRIGALTTHAEVEGSPEIAAALPLLAQAAPHIAHAAIRNAGTFGGSIAMPTPPRNGRRAASRLTLHSSSPARPAAGGSARAISFRASTPPICNPAKS